uniref:Uncharacterized protein n=2 Tax=Palpitomonas bilix TaxID=652834 RepID=A0A7S3LY19_9EUKA|mmetsp:Transcript_9843/g.26211  ORF Transcript_9843/g.26211 Transcript_9843/m.26211 type:complete len:115 (+) Transcript_9843:125-469(+)
MTNVGHEAKKFAKEVDAAQPQHVKAVTASPLISLKEDMVDLDGLCDSIGSISANVKECLSAADHLQTETKKALEEVSKSSKEAIAKMEAAHAEEVQALNGKTGEQVAAIRAKLM